MGPLIRHTYLVVIISFFFLSGTNSPHVHPEQVERERVLYGSRRPAKLNEANQMKTLFIK